MDIEERKRLIGQLNKEWLDKLMKYKQGVMFNGSGIVLVVPVEEYKEWIKEE